MAIKLFVISILILNIVCCNNNSSKSNSISNNERIKFLNNASSKDSIVQYFLNYIKNNNLTIDLINYEDDLIKQKILADISLSSFEKYVKYVVQNENIKQCTTKEIVSSFQNAATKFNFSIVDNKYGNNKIGKSKELIFYEYLITEGGLNILKALEYAMENNTITTEKKYFYLFLLMPSKICA